MREAGEAELVSEWTGLPGERKSVKRFERSNGLDTALYKNYLYLLCPPKLTCLDECMLKPMELFVMLNKINGIIVQINEIICYVHIDGIICYRIICYVQINLIICHVRINGIICYFQINGIICIGVNRPAVGGTVPHFHQMSREISRCSAFFENGIIFFPLPIILHVCLTTQQSDELRIKIGSKFARRQATDYKYTAL